MGLRQKLTVSEILLKAAEIIDMKHRLNGPSEISISGVGGNLGVRLSYDQQGQPDGSYFILLDAAQKFGNTRLTDRQPGVALNVRGVGVHVVDYNLLSLQAPVGRISHPTLDQGAVEPGQKFVVSFKIDSDDVAKKLRAVLDSAQAQATVKTSVSDGRRTITAEGPASIVTHDLFKNIQHNISVNQEKAKPRPTAVAKLVSPQLSTWDFGQTYAPQFSGQRLNLVGQHHRHAAEQDVLRSKSLGNMALLVREPDNPHDPNAVMVMVWNTAGKSWTHVGYVRASQAAVLAASWPMDFPGGQVKRMDRLVLVATIDDVPYKADGHRGGRNIILRTTGQVRYYPGFDSAF